MKLAFLLQGTDWVSALGGRNHGFGVGQSVCMVSLTTTPPPHTHRQNSKDVEEDGAESRAGACPFPSLGLAVPGGTLCVCVCVCVCV